MLKVSYALTGGDVLRIKADTFDEEVSSRPEGVLGYGRQFADTTALAGDDQRQRYAVQLEYEFVLDGPWAESARMNLFGQRSRVHQLTDERRAGTAPPVAIERSFDYLVEDVGGTLDLVSRFDSGHFAHRLGWGASLRRFRVEEKRGGFQRDLSSGAVSRTLLGETLPVRAFPISTITESALYLHDEISAGAVTLIPGLRLEHYRLNGKADPLYREDHPDLPIEDLSESALVPKLGIQWRLSEAVDLFAQYARGFRAPPFEDVNIGLDYAVPFRVRATPNPDLRAETSDGLEAGLKFRGDRLHASVVLFGADYDDFIESKASLGFDPDSGALLIQSRNVARARVYGAELSATAELSPALSLHGSASWIRGESRVTDEPLNTVDPATLTTRLDWAATERWLASLAMRAAVARNRVDETDVDLFEPDGYVVFDLTAGFTPTASVRVNAGVFNLTDRTYWRWPSVRGRPEGDPLVDLLAAPGRYGAVSVHVDL